MELNHPYPVIYMDIAVKWQSGITFPIINTESQGLPSAILSHISMKKMKRD